MSCAACNLAIDCQSIGMRFYRYLCTFLLLAAHPSPLHNSSQPQYRSATQQMFNRIPDRDKSTVTDPVNYSITNNTQRVLPCFPVLSRRLPLVVDDLIYRWDRDQRSTKTLTTPSGCIGAVVHNDIKRIIESYLDKRVFTDTDPTCTERFRRCTHAITVRDAAALEHSVFARSSVLFSSP